MSTSSLCLTEQQAKLLESLEEEFKDRYTENDKGFLATLKEPPSMPPVVENWRDFRRRNRSRSRNWYSDDHERRRYGDGNSDRYSHSFRHDHGYKERNYHPNRNRWH